MQNHPGVALEEGGRDARSHRETTVGQTRKSAYGHSGNACGKHSEAGERLEQREGTAESSELQACTANSLIFNSAFTLFCNLSGRSGTLLGDGLTFGEAGQLSNRCAFKISIC